MAADAHGLCGCGCGEQTRIAKYTVPARGYVKGQPRRFLPGHANRLRTGARSRLWRGGRAHVSGYVAIYTSPEHPRAKRCGTRAGYVFEHLLVAERALGRPVPLGCPVHHVNEDRADNRPQNLVVCQDDSYHKLLHQRQRALDACGDASARRCVYCSTYDSQHDVHITTGGRAYHRACARAYNRGTAAKRRQAKGVTC